MRLRYKDTKEETSSSSFNTFALCEVLTGDDSVYIKDLEVFVGGKWKDLGQAFRDKDVIPDNYNTVFGEPQNDADRERGYFA